MDIAAKSAEQEEERCQHVLQRGMVAERISQPLPPEIQPPHVDLRDERCLPVGQRRLRVLAAIKVVQEAIVGRLAERAANADPGRAAGRLTFVDGGKVRRTERLREKRRYPEQQGAGNE